MVECVVAPGLCSSGASVGLDFGDAEPVGMVDTGAADVVDTDDVELVEDFEVDVDVDLEVEDDDDDEEVLASSFSSALRLAASFASSSSVRPYEKPRPCLFASYGAAE